MSEIQQKRPWYTEDFLYIIAEKLLARIPDGGRINFCEQNPYTFFMGHNEVAFRTIISQFAKFKRIEFTKDGYGEQIHFYKNEKFGYSDSEPEEFLGPYIIPPGMLEYIIEKGKFRVNTIETFDFLPDDHSVEIKELGEMNSLKAFCALFLGKEIQIPDGLNNNIMVKKFRVHGPVESIQKNLETILAIDAVELEISNADNIIIFDSSQYKSPIIANNTTKVTVNCQFDVDSFKEDLEKFATNFETFCSFIVRVCPALNNLQFTFTILTYIDTDYYIDPNEFSDNLHSTIKSMEASIKSIKIGNEHLQISIQLETNFSRDAYIHDFFKLGTPFTVDEDDKITDGPYIARSLECADSLGRIHKLLFKIFEDNSIDEYVDSLDSWNDYYDSDGSYHRNYSDADDYNPFY